MHAIARISSFLSLPALLVSCSGGGSIDLSGPLDFDFDLPDQAIGGIWVGTDSSGLEILALSTESGRLHWVAPQTEEQGFGTGSVSGFQITLDYTYVAPFGFVLADGSSSASCSASGTINEFTSISVSTTCDTSAGGTFSNSAFLNYDSLYERDSSLATIAGNYDDAGLTFNIAGNGVIFEQDPDTGCVTNGQVSIIDSQFNAYDILTTLSNCEGEFAVFNGATFTGLATLNNTVTPETVVFALTGDVQGVTVSAVSGLQRL